MEAHRLSGKNHYNPASLTRELVFDKDGKTEVNGVSERLMAGTYTPKISSDQVRQQLRQLDPFFADDVETTPCCR